MKTKTTTAKKSPARAPRVSPSAPKPAKFPPEIVDAVRSSEFEVHVHPHLIQIHDAASIRGESLPFAHITSPRPDSARILAQMGAGILRALEMGGRPEALQIFDATGKRVDFGHE